MKIFITGVESFVGKKLIEEFKKFPKIKIFGCDLKIKKTKFFIKADIRQKEFYKKIPKNIDVIIHLAVLISRNCS